MSYFTMTINAKSEEELDKRIQDSEKRGFEVVKRGVQEKSRNVWHDEGYRPGGEGCVEAQRIRLLQELRGSYEKVQQRILGESSR